VLDTLREEWWVIKYDNYAVNTYSESQRADIGEESPLHGGKLT
jgi:hypothetical protein